MVWLHGGGFLPVADVLGDDGAASSDRSPTTGQRPERLAVAAEMSSAWARFARPANLLVEMSGSGSDTAGSGASSSSATPLRSSWLLRYRLRRERFPPYSPERFLKFV